MNRRTPPGPARGTRRPELERLDDRIVPDATGTSTVPVTEPPPSDTVTTTPPVDTPEIAIKKFAVGTDVGNRATVRVYDNTGSMLSEFVAYPKDGFIGGVRVTTADLTGDGVDDIITAPGPGMKTTIQVFDGVSGQKLISFNAYADNFTGGAYVATGDVNGDGRADLVVGAGDTGGSHVKVFDGAGLFPADDVAITVAPGPNTNLIREFFAYDPRYNVGARVAVSDINGDGKADIITGAGNTGGPHVRIFSGEDGSIIREFFAFDANVTTGVFVAGGDVNGDGTSDVVVGMGPNASGRVNVFDGRNGRMVRSFIADDESVRASIRVGVFDADHDGDADIVLGVRSELKFFDGKTYVRSGGMTPFDPGNLGGVFFG